MLTPKAKPKQTHAEVWSITIRPASTPINKSPNSRVLPQGDYTVEIVGDTLAARTAALKHYVSIFTAGVPQELRKCAVVAPDGNHYQLGQVLDVITGQYQTALNYGHKETK